ncbi:unnamed protein product [Arabidopsis halleri]
MVTCLRWCCGKTLLTIGDDSTTDLEWWFNDASEVVVQRR